MAKPELGTKRLCANCGAKFYDLSKNPIICPKCETVFVVPVIPVRASRSEAARAAPKAAVVEPETAEAEFVSLEDADAEQQGKKPASAAAGDEEIEEEDTAAGGDDDTFIEEEDEGTDDVTDIIGDAGEKEEEN